MADEHSMLGRNERAALIEWLDSMQLDHAAVLVEVGCYRGGTTIELAAWLRAAADGKIYAIDPHREFEGVYGGKFCQRDCDSFRENVNASGLDGYIEHLCTPSTDAAKHWDKSIDCLFIDGDHSYQGVCDDINAWIHKVRHGGLVVFDDWVEGSEVERAALDCLDRSQCVSFAVYGKLRAFRVSHAASSHLESLSPDSKVAHRPVIGASIPLMLAGGLQSGGTTLLSWCFLQRRDMDGILDLPFDQLIDMPAHAAPVSWCKMTVASFRWQDVADYYGFQGFQVRPLLIVRDVRNAYASLKHKEYGRNGTTAEDPPLRLRLLRFLRDWQQFHDNGWPILRFESLLADPEKVLRDTCSALGLSWDPGMMDWPKRPDQLCDISRGNETFWLTEQTGGLRGAIKGQIERPPALNRAEAEWLDETFAAFNEVNGYPAHTDTCNAQDAEFPVPSFELSSRKRLYDQIADQSAELAESHLYRGRLVSRLINAFPYPRKMLRALHGRPDGVRCKPDC